ncbi:TPA: hypothetical protein AB5H59_003750 [Vibrio mimicus]
MDSTTAGFLGVFAGALLSFLSNLVVSRRQSETSRVAIKIETLQKKILKLETALSEYGKVTMDISGENIPEEQMLGNGMMLFSQRVSVTKSIHYLLPKPLIDDILEINSKVGTLIFNEKTGKKNLAKDALDIFEKVQELDRQLPDAISHELRVCQEKLDNEIGA